MPVYGITVQRDERNVTPVSFYHIHVHTHTQAYQASAKSSKAVEFNYFRVFKHQGESCSILNDKIYELLRTLINPERY